MKTLVTVEELLRWRLAAAETAAPPAPRAARLLGLARPWWETWPEQFHTLAQRLDAIQISYGHAMAEPRFAAGEHPVPAILVRPPTEIETSVRVLYFQIRDRRLRLRFRLDRAAGAAESVFEVTFVAEGALPLFSTPASASLDDEYRLDAELTEELELAWKTLKVTDRMPFRLILRPGSAPG